MEYFIGAISVISLILNTLIYKRITATYVLGSVEEFELAAAHICQCGSNIEHLSFDVDEVGKLPDEDSPPPTQNAEAYKAWTNRQGIPWVPPTKGPEPIVKAPNRGPLARPDGFV